MKIATWNVNSVRVRMQILLDWLDAAGPDVLLLQETKALPEKVPLLEIEARGYRTALIGEPARNGVAILAKAPIEALRTRLPGDDADEEARYIEAVVDGLRVASVYVPNGTAVDSERFAYKLAFFDRLRTHAETLLEDDIPFVIGGDYNVAPAPRDVYDPEELEGTICYHPQERAKLRTLLHLGLYDAYRVLAPTATEFSWWHYQGRAFEIGHGLRIDHLLLSPPAVDRLQAAGIDQAPRHRKSPSDHTPVWCSLAAA